MSFGNVILGLVAKPGYELKKYQAQRFFQRLGLRLELSRNAKFSYDACNFQGVPSGTKAVICDVGANIGQSSIWFSKSFPQASIFAFEPFAAVYQRLTKELEGRAKIRCIQTAIGAFDGEIKVPKITDPCFQMGQVVAATGSDEATEPVTVQKLETFCAKQGVEKIHILKSDTEGHDLDVLRGAETMLRAGRINNFLTEASIQAGDRQHTNLFELIDFLKPFSMELHGLYDLHHTQQEGRLDYFNALFCRKP